mmetsp:Transcript_14636/g.35349  ORF Transcript_14636/g.35349 Transcript_14636/m.35349 type:complete len:397 (+) Transcript_14636:1402-2592(+)
MPNVHTRGSVAMPPTGLCCCAWIIMLQISRSLSTAPSVIRNTKGTEPDAPLFASMLREACSGVMMSVVPRALHAVCTHRTAASSASDDAATSPSGEKYSCRLSNAMMLNLSAGVSMRRPVMSASLALSMGEPLMEPLRSWTKTTERGKGAQRSGRGGAMAMANALRMSCVGPLGAGCCTAAATTWSAHTGMRSTMLQLGQGPSRGSAMICVTPLPACTSVVGCVLHSIATGPGYALRTVAMNDSTLLTCALGGRAPGGSVVGASNTYAPSTKASGWKYVTVMSTVSPAGTLGMVMANTSGCVGMGSATLRPKRVPLKPLVSATGTTQDAICFFFMDALMLVTVPFGLSGTANEHALALPPCFRSAAGTTHLEVAVTNAVDRWHSTLKDSSLHCAAL